MRGRAGHVRQLGVAGAVGLAAAAWLLPPPLRPGTLALAAVAGGAGGRAGGVIVAAVAALAPVPGPVRGAIVVAALVAAELEHRNRAARRTLRARSFTDRLTGLRNYDYFSEVLRSELARVRRYGGCVTLVMLDSTGSRPTTTATATGRAIGCWRRSAIRWRARSATPTSPPASAAKSSRCSCPGAARMPS